MVKKGGKRLFFFVLMGYKREKLEEISYIIPPFYAVFEALEGWGETESVFLHKKDGHFLLVVNKNQISTCFAGVVERRWRGKHGKICIFNCKHSVNVRKSPLTKPYI